MKSIATILLTVSCLGAGALRAGAAKAAPVPAPVNYRFSQRGVRLPGPQLQYNAVFQLMDFNGDGKLDLFTPTTSMMMFSVQLNDGTASEPHFGHSIGYPLNITETVPQTTEHTQSFTTCDLNSDGLWDMIFFDGQLRYTANIGTPHGPYHWDLYREKEEKPQFFPGSAAMIRENARYSTGPESMYWTRGIFARQVLTLTAADWDGDGLQDLLISRFKGEAPGVKPIGGRETWGAWGRFSDKPTNPPPAASEPKFLGALSEAPERGLYFYKNVGTRDRPWFDKGVEITTPDGKSIAAPNPEVYDVDGDGAADLLSTETAYRCNAFRVDWPTAPNVMWLRRATAADVAHLQPPAPLQYAGGKPVPAGNMVRVGDMDNNGSQDIVVLNADMTGSARWYPNGAKSGKALLGAPRVLTGSDFLRFDFIVQSQVVNWFGPNSRDLIVHGDIDQHCKFALRRTALYKNVATKPGEIKYEFSGWFNYKGDEAMVASNLERSIYDTYGSAVAVSPFESGAKQLVMSVGGRLYRFSKLDKDGLSFQECTPVDVKAQQNQGSGWQEVPVESAEPVKYIRLSGSAPGNFRDHGMHIVTFEALSAGKNVATLANVQEVKTAKQGASKWSQVRRPTLMFTPGNTDSDATPNFSSFRTVSGPATITLKEPAKLEKIRFLLSAYEESMYSNYWPFYWQGQLYRQNMEPGQPWIYYSVEVSADGKTWAAAAKRGTNEMNRSHPVLVDWDKDGKQDLVLGVQSSGGEFPLFKDYRLYRNTGTNEQPKYGKYESFCDETGTPIQLKANWATTYTAQCGISLQDMDGDGKMDFFAEGNGGGEVVYYKNVSADPAHELKFKRYQTPRELTPGMGAGDRHYFWVGDLDGDGIPDYLQSSWATFNFYKGITATAPARANSIRVVKTTNTDATIEWERPPGAATYEIRWGRGDVDDSTWGTLPAVTGSYGADVKAGTLQTATLTGLQAGESVNVALKSANAKNETSAISQSIPVALAPLAMVVLRNGPGTGPGVPAYSGTESTTLDGAKPTEAAKPGMLAAFVLSGTPLNRAIYRMVLLRFKDLPKVAGVQQAILELTTNNPNNVILALSANSIRDDWDCASATWDAPAAGRIWEKDELVRGGKFLSTAQMDFTLDPRRAIKWDVTQAVRDAQAANKTSLSLLIRVDYTGKYISGSGYNFYGADDPDISVRPRLRIVGRS